MGVRSGLTFGIGINENIESKFYDLYGDTLNRTSYNYRILGDATAEFGPNQSTVDPDNSLRYKSSWYYDLAHFVNSSSPWFQRGGHCYDGIESGIFAFNNNTGAEIERYPFRVVLAI